MRPLVAKVKVGDVLHSTRNLRNYLRTSSLLQRVEGVRQGKDRTRLKALHTPSKDDEFVVAVNAWGVFGVWCKRDSLVIIWSDPRKESDGSVSTHASRGMTPDRFAHWFVRTKYRQPDLREWPRYAYNMWAFLQLNALASTPDYQGGWRLDRYHPFNFHTWLANMGDHQNVQNHVRTAIKKGFTRSKLGGKTNISPGGGGSGPKITDMESMQESLRKLLSNPRFRNKVTESGINPASIDKYTPNSVIY